MSLWAVVPVKSLGEGKSRLAQVLSKEDRRLLNNQLFQHTLNVLSHVAAIDEICVISTDPDVLDHAKSLGLKTMVENGSGLNEALTQVTLAAIVERVQQLFILPVDLPFLKQSDAEIFLHMLEGKPGVVIAPDRKKTGTNALMVSPPGALDYQFGVDSFNLHYHQALARKLPVRVCCLSSLEFDIDLPEDFLEVKDLLAVPMGLE
jgi:2-phospho-L-lactate guanylyltransferase